MITPYLLFSESALHENMQQLNRIVVDRTRRWAARLTGLVPMNMLKEVILPVTQVASCSTIPDAEYLADAGFHRIILVGRALDVESLRRLRCVAERAQVVAVIDHFRHAELLSQCVLRSTCAIEILIDIDVGRQSTGVQPGADAALLASAASQLPGLKVMGVFVSAVDVCSRQSLVSRVDEQAAVVQIADHARRSIVNAPHGGEIVIATSFAWESLIGDLRIQCLVVNPFCRVEKSSRDTGKQPVVCVVATVISRPSLEFCVIDAGQSVLSDASGSRVVAPGGASILQMMPETCTLCLTGDSCDLRIGDTVRLAVPEPEYLLNRNNFLTNSATTASEQDSRWPHGWH